MTISNPIGYLRFFPAIVGPAIGEGLQVRVALHGLHPDIYNAIDEPEVVEQIGAATIRMKIKRHGNVEMVFTGTLCGFDGNTLGVAPSSARVPNGGSASPTQHDGGELASPEIP